MKLITSAQACGFGPASKLLSVVKLLPDAEIDFIGDGIALDFMRRNPGHFHAIDECEPERARDVVRDRAGRYDAAIVVMHAELAFWAVRFRMPVSFFDSLFSFWKLERPLAELAQIVRRWEALEDGDAYAGFISLAPHERNMAAHLLAHHSFVQRFAGVDERVSALRELGFEHIEVTGSMIDAQHASLSDSAPPPMRPNDYSIVASLGGYKNFLLDFDRNDEYLRLIERWAADFMRARPQCKSMMLCSGAYLQPRTISIDGRLLTMSFASHDEFLLLVRRTPVILCTPGLTSIHETMHLGRLPLLLPEEHYGHVFNRRGLAGTRLGLLAVGLEDVIGGYDLPDDDFAGTAAIVAVTRAILESPDRYAAFSAAMTVRVDAYVEFLASADGELGQHVDEVRSLLEGPPLTDAVESLLARHALYDGAP